MDYNRQMEHSPIPITRQTNLQRLVPRWKTDRHCAALEMPWDVLALKRHMKSLMIWIKGGQKMGNKEQHISTFNSVLRFWDSSANAPDVQWHLVQKAMYKSDKKEVHTQDSHMVHKAEVKSFDCCVTRYTSTDKEMNKCTLSCAGNAIPLSWFIW